MLRSKNVKLVNKSFFLRYGWFLVIVFIVVVTYLRADIKKNRQIDDVAKRLDFLKSEKQRVLADRENLLLKLNSQSDPAWVELVLMQELGVVPEGKLKVHFTRD